VEIQKEEVAKSAMEALLSLIRHDGVDKKISFTARLVIRESTGKKCYCKQ
jgi:DNA-binding LacI/PurR family transcriptional regulator